MAVMTPRDPLGRAVLRVVLIVVSVALCLYLIYLLRTPITWLVIAAFIAIAVSGPVNLLQRHMKRGLAVALVYSALVLIPIGLGALFIPSLVGQIENFGENVPQYAQDVTDFVNNNQTLNDLNDKYDFTGELQSLADDLPSKIGDAAGVLQDIGVGVINSIFAAVTILILSIFMVSGGPRWAQAVVRAQPPERASRVERAFSDVANAIGNYVAGALVQATLAGVTAFIVLTILGAPFAGLLALIVAFFDLIPVVGATIGGRTHRGRAAVRQLPGRGDRLGRLCDRLPAGRELPDPAADPEARGPGGGVHGPGRGPVRLDPVRDPRRRAGDPRGGDAADHLARVPRLPARVAGRPAARGRRALDRSSRVAHSPALA